MAKLPPAHAKLPNELWDIIFSYGFTRKDFLTLSTIDRFFNEAVEPSLYSSFSWLPRRRVALPSVSNLKGRDIRPYTKSRRRSWTELPPSFFSQMKPYLLLRSILEKPKRAGYVKEVKLLATSSDTGLFWDEYQTRECGFNTAQFKACKRTIDLLPAALHSYWIDSLYKGRLDVIIGLLILRLTGLTSVEIRLRDTSTIGSPVFDALRSSLDSSPHYNRYPNLRSVKLSVDYKSGGPARMISDHFEEDIFHTHHPVPNILEFRRLESLSLFCCSPGVSWHGNLSTATNLKKLTLRHGVINEHTLAIILTATPHLEDLECELIYDDGALRYLDCDLLKATLSLVKRTLTRLVIDIRVFYGPGWNPTPWDIQGFMGSLKDLKKLKYLDIPIILYAREIFEASRAASLVVFEDRQVDYWADRMPDGLEWFGIRAAGPHTDYSHQHEANRCVDVYLRLNPGIKRIEPTIDMGDEDEDEDEDENWGRY